MNYRPYDDFIRLLFFHDHLDREESALANELEESDQFRLLRAAQCLANLKGSVG